MTRNMNRRSFVQKTTAAGAAVSLAGLGTSNMGYAAAQSTPGDITIPDPAVELPTDDVSFRWIDSGDLKALFY